MRQTSPSTFERTASARQSNERDTLRKETGLSDEQIEGWFIMVKREVRFFLSFSFLFFFSFLFLSF